MLINNPCDICLEETCKGLHNCNCKDCKVINECPRYLRPTIRITNRCTQECSHCCFNSSPKSIIMMSLETAKEIATFLEKNNILSLNLMGGEFFCNPKWFEIFDLFINVAESSRIVSNGDWAGNTEVKKKLIELHESYPGKFRIHISKDRWHTNKNVSKAIKFLNEVGIENRITDESEASDNSIIPIGRSEFHYNFYSSVECYCHSSIHKYTFLIDEIGKIYKCSFGIWSYAKVQDYLNGEFNYKFKEFNKKFYGIFISSCRSCIKYAEDRGYSVLRK